ncbi:hypothetical protein [Nocardia sp. bgisy118]|uniref:hypothetical protein n=1 Tax=Nocardia sp. bgisy118 TaxID=3413786 RepID=UPI003F4A7D3F
MVDATAGEIDRERSDGRRSRRAERSNGTPWATGVVEDDDHDRAERSDRVVRFLRLMQRRGKDLPVDEQADEEFFHAEMARNGVTPADVDWDTGSGSIFVIDPFGMRSGA